MKVLLEYKGQVYCDVEDNTYKSIVIIIIAETKI